QNPQSILNPAIVRLLILLSYHPKIILFAIFAASSVAVATTSSLVPVPVVVLPSVAVPSPCAVLLSSLPVNAEPDIPSSSAFSVGEYHAHTAMMKYVSISRRPSSQLVLPSRTKLPTTRTARSRAKAMKYSNCRFMGRLAHQPTMTTRGATNRAVSP